LPALVAVVRRAERRVHLDPAWCVGDTIECSEGDEVRLVRTSEHGHMAVHAKAVAAVLRSAGWRVSVRDCSDLRPREVRVVGRVERRVTYNSGEASQAGVESGAALLDEIGDVRQPRPDTTLAYSPPEPPPPPDELPPVEDFLPAEATRRRSPRQFREVCLTCGHPTRQGPGMDSHVKNLGHSEFQRTPIEDVPALQAKILQERIRAALAYEQASAPEAPEAPLDAPGQRANGISHPERPAALQGFRDGGPP
jgi:hypothetical protein